VPNTITIVGAMFGMVGLTTSLVLNNGFNFLACMNGMLPYFDVMEEAETETWAQPPGSLLAIESSSHR